MHRSGGSSGTWDGGGEHRGSPSWGWDLELPSRETWLHRPESPLGESVLGGQLSPTWYLMSESVAVSRSGLLQGKKDTSQILSKWAMSSKKISSSLNPPRSSVPLLSLGRSLQP